MYRPSLIYLKLFLHDIWCKKMPTIQIKLVNGAINNVFLITSINWSYHIDRGLAGETLTPPPPPPPPPPIPLGFLYTHIFSKVPHLGVRKSMWAKWKVSSSYSYCHLFTGFWHFSNKGVGLLFQSYIHYFHKSTHIIARMKAKMMLFLMVKTDLQNLLR